MTEFLHQHEIYCAFIIWTVVGFFAYIILDKFVFRKLLPLTEKLFFAIIVSLYVVSMSYGSFTFGIIVFLMLLFFGHQFHDRYLAFKKPLKKENPDGSVL